MDNTRNTQNVLELGPNNIELETSLSKEARVSVIADRLLALESLLNGYKTLYAEKDALTLELMNLVGLEKEVTVGDSILFVQDNFKNGNVVYRPTGVRRFDLEIDSVAARAEKAIKKAKKEAKKLINV